MSKRTTKKRPAGHVVVAKVPPGLLDLATKINERVTGLVSRVSAIETMSAGREWSDWRARTDALIDQLDTGLHKVETKVEGLGNLISADATRIGALERDKQSKDEWLGSHARQLTELDKKVTALEAQLGDNMAEEDVQVEGRIRRDEGVDLYQQMLDVPDPKSVVIATPRMYSLSVPTEDPNRQATVEWRDARPNLVMLHVGDFMNETGIWIRMSKAQAKELVAALQRAIDHKAP